MNYGERVDPINCLIKPFERGIPSSYVSFKNFADFVAINRYEGFNFSRCEYDKAIG